MEHYRAQIQYTEETIPLLCKVVYTADRGYVPLLIALFGLGMIAGGVSLGLERPAGLALVFAGSVAVTNTNLFLRRLTKRMCALLSGWQPTVQYRFLEREFAAKTDREETVTAYAQITRLVQTPDYLYLFAGKKTAFMIDAATVVPDDLAAFRQFLSEKAGLQWKRASRFSISI